MTTQRRPNKKTEAYGHFFGIAKEINQRIKLCQNTAKEGKVPEIIYLWVCVNATGLKHGIVSSGEPEKEWPMHQWLNIVDEAATLGATWLVLSVADPLCQCDAVWPISRWAQQIHGMDVGLHLKQSSPLTEQEIKLIRQLDRKKTRLLLRNDSEDTLRKLTKHNITVWKANPQAEGEVPNCQGPTRMIFVNDKGILYTCGLVDGKNAYRMGHVFDTELRKILHEEGIPRCVQKDLHYITPDCDGCPSLLANFFLNVQQ